MPYPSFPRFPHFSSPFLPNPKSSLAVNVKAKRFLVNFETEIVLFLSLAQRRTLIQFGSISERLFASRLNRPPRCRNWLILHDSKKIIMRNQTPVGVTQQVLAVEARSLPPHHVRELSLETTDTPSAMLTRASIIHNHPIITISIFTSSAQNHAREKFDTICSQR